MPPVGGKLSDSQIAAFEHWIAEGASWTSTLPAGPSDWIAPIKPISPPVPVNDQANPIDKFIADYFAKNKLAYADPLDDALFLRRATLDIWGIVPTLDQTKQFVADKDPNKRAHLIDSLLADKKKYAGHWISFWNDLLRNDQGVNYAGTRKSITPWLLGALENNMPFDKMAYALLSPEKPSDPDGFLIGVNWRGDINASQTPFMQAAQNSAQVFLGVNLKCASCHDSFINKYKLKQSYGLAAMFAETSDLELVRCDAKTGKHTGPEFLFPEVAVSPRPIPLQIVEKRRRSRSPTPKTAASRAHWSIGTGSAFSGEAWCRMSTIWMRSPGMRTCSIGSPRILRRTITTLST
jgi:hypothetical protein